MCWCIWCESFLAVHSLWLKSLQVMLPCVGLDPALSSVKQGFQVCFGQVPGAVVPVCPGQRACGKARCCAGRCCASSLLWSHRVGLLMHPQPHVVLGMSISFFPDSKQLLAWLCCDAGVQQCSGRTSFKTSRDSVQASTQSSAACEMPNQASRMLWGWHRSCESFRIRLPSICWRMEVHVGREAGAQQNRGLGFFTEIWISIQKVIAWNQVVMRDMEEKRALNQMSSLLGTAWACFTCLMKAKGSSLLKLALY